MKNRIRYSFLFAVCFFIGSLGIYYCLCYVKGECLYKYIPHVNKFPIAYIAVVSIALALCLLTFVERILANTDFTKRSILTVFFLFFWLFLSCVLGGVLWAYHDLGTSYYLGGYSSFFWKALKNVGDALGFGTIVLLCSIPYNIFCLCLLLFLTKLPSSSIRLLLCFSALNIL